MANPTLHYNQHPLVVNATTSAVEITLSKDREYTIEHLGYDNSGSVSAGILFMTTDDSSPVTDHIESANTTTSKIILLPGRSVVIGPGISKLEYETDVEVNFGLHPHPMKAGNI